MNIQRLTDNIKIFLFGRRFKNEENAKHGPLILRFPEPIWEMAPSGSFEFKVHLTAAPCFLHRWAQTVLLGIRYRRVPIKEDAK